MRALAIPGSLVALGLLAGPSFGQTVDGGTLHFDYSQLPFGPYGGTFHAEGNLLGLSSFPDDGQGGCAAFLAEHEGEHLLVILGGFGNGDASADAAFLALHSSEPFAPGVYIAGGLRCHGSFGFVDDAHAPGIPEDPTRVDWIEYLDGLLAEHQFLATIGTIVISSVGSDHVTGTFTGIMADPVDHTVIAVSDASFSMGLTTVSVDTETWAGIKARHRN